MACYEIVLTVIMSVPEYVWEECCRTCSSYLHKCYWGYWLVTAVLSDSILHSHVVFIEYLGNQTRSKKRPIMYFIQHQQNNKVYLQG